MSRRGRESQETGMPEYSVEVIQLAGDHLHQAGMLQDRLNMMAAAGYEFIFQVGIDIQTMLLTFVRIK